MLITPTKDAGAQAAVSLEFELGPCAFTAQFHGSEGGHNWSTSQLIGPNAEAYKTRLDKVFSSHGIREAHTVNATEFNTVILSPGDFSLKKSLSTSCYWQAPENPAEGLSLPVGHTAFQGPAGCYTIVASRYNSHDRRVYDPVKAHAGRWSLIRPRTVFRKHESVCYAVLEKLGVGTPYEAKDVWVKILWGIRPEEFPHKLREGPHADTNTWLWWYVNKNGWASGSIVQGDIAYFSLAMIAKHQLMQRGVPAHQIKLEHADLPPGAYKDGRANQPRNLVVVKRLS
ncbi:MAG TPA: hypothetical protein VJJ20_02865 [Candidatus Paceibacterota bacterium]